MKILAVTAAGFLLDLLLGDPAWMPHPVVFMGKAISRGEEKLRAVFPGTPTGEQKAGRVLAFLLPVATWLLSAGCLWLLELFSRPLAVFLEIVWCWQALAMKDLARESTNVYGKLTQGTIEEARQAVSRIVGRDTACLSAEGVAKAAVETVAENFSDGVIAPLTYMLIGGAPLALCYKAVNTMDSMIGYKNRKYLHFGRAAARLDDAANYLPARLSALLLIAAAFLMTPIIRGEGKTGKQTAADAYRIWKRDRRKHASPNSAQPEAAMAGALGIRLGGPAWYFGEYHDKPFIGDSTKSVEPEDILRADRLLYAGGFLGLVLSGSLRLIVVLFLLH